MGGRATAIEKLLGAVLLSAFVVYIIPLWHPKNFFATFLLLAGISISAYAMAKFLSGDSDKTMLMVIALVIVAEALLFALNPLGVAN